MDQISTQNLLLQLIYNELDESSSIKLKTQISENPTLAQEYRRIRKDVSLLDKFQMKPSESSISRIQEEIHNNFNEEYSL